jgi:tRNA dimethylallyltransferase
MENPFHRAVYLTGPTASGKTAIGVLLARRLEAEIIAMDSMTLYRGMNIGTAKPTPAERAGVPHHLIDALDPWQQASVANYREWARSAIEAIESRGKRVLFVGGTALYLKALIRGLFEGPAADLSLRQRLEEAADQHGNEALHEWLKALDPATAARLHPNDRRRIIRALEIFELTGQPLSRLQAEHDRPAPRETMVIALERPRAELYERIDRRVTAMFEAGLVEEVKALMAGPRLLSPVAAQAVGYREVIELLEGKFTLDETIQRVQTRSRQFAKRQATWFRGLAEVRHWPVDCMMGDEAVADEIARLIASRRERKPGDQDDANCLLT